MTREAIREADLNIRRAEEVLGSGSRLKTGERLNVLAAVRRVRYAKSANNPEDILASTRALGRVLDELRENTAPSGASAKRRGPYRGPGGLGGDGDKKPYYGC